MDSTTLLLPGEGAPAELCVLEVRSETGQFVKTPVKRDRRAYRHAYYLAHREQENARTNAWRDAHKDETNRRSMHAERRRRRERALTMRQKHPRCVICGDPINWGKTGIRDSTRTCGKKTCYMKLYRWFRVPEKTAA